MQLPNPPPPDAIDEIERALHPQRLSRYRGVAPGNGAAAAIRIFQWNCLLAEQLLVPLQLAEVVSRNAIQGALLKRFGQSWYTEPLLLAQLRDHHKADIQEIVRGLARRNRAISHDRMVSEMPWGFWEELLVPKFDNILWSNGVRRWFPHLPKTMGREDIRSHTESLRRFRNRIAHHKAIFDRGPMKRLNEALDLIGWVSPETRSWAASTCQLAQAMELRP